MTSSITCRTRPKKLLLLVTVAIVACLLISVVRQYWGVSRHVSITDREPYAIYDTFEAPGSAGTTRNERLPALKLRKRPNFRTSVNKEQVEFHEENEFDEEELAGIFEPLERVGKEPKWEIAKVLRDRPKSRASGKSAVPVFVVEEHFEVLKYWFDAVSTGLLPSKGNTVLHIDGHSDLGPPRDLTLIPWFRLPRNHSEVADMMQSNDAFIIGSAITGLITRYIWIWPHWDRHDHTNGRHVIMDVRVGWRTYHPVNGEESFRQLCACTKERNDDEDSWECLDDRPTASEVGKTVSDMDPKECQTVMTVVMEIIHEEKALHLLRKGGWIKKDEPLMLDIDEDYFGCESSAMPLLNAGLTLSKVDDLTTLLARLLCANDVAQEALSDKVFRAVLHAVVEFKASLCDHKHRTHHQACKASFNEDHAVNRLFPTVDGIFVKHQKQGGGDPDKEAVTCDLPKTKRILLVRTLIRDLVRLDSSQLDALNYVGVCLKTAPTSIWFRPDETLHVCHGFNVPNDTAVSFHVPTVKESEIRSRLLRETLSLLPAHPSVVTVCRSMRDGYTPWSYFEFAEKAVFGALNATIENVTEESYHFDENLLGGKKGWPNRYH